MIFFESSTLGPTGYRLANDEKMRFRNKKFRFSIFIISMIPKPRGNTPGGLETIVRVPKQKKKSEIWTPWI